MDKKTTDEKIDNLARMVAGGFSSIENRMATKDDMNAKFEKIDERFDKVDENWGMDIVITTTAKTDAEAKALLKHFNMPFNA